MDILSLATIFFKYASILSDIEHEAREQVWKERRSVTENAIRDEAKSSGRDPELELRAYRNREMYYSWPSVGELHEEELKQLKRKMIRSLDDVAAFEEAAEEMVRDWAAESHRDPDDQVDMLRRSGISGLYETHWPRQWTRALWTYF